MKSSSAIKQELNAHEYPKVLLRFPFVVRVAHAATSVLELRNWYVYHGLRRAEKTQGVGSTFLDAGCGAGKFAIGVSKRHRDAQVTGIDINASSILVARRIAESMNLHNVDFQLGDLTNWHSDNRYDLILCNATLQFIKDDLLALRNLRAALKPSGTMLLYVSVTHRRY